MNAHCAADASWMTKPTDRFILKWIKCTLSARVTQRLTRFECLRPGMITVFSMVLGIASGCLFAISWGVFGGLLAAGSQIMDGVDGQLARLTGRSGSHGAFLDSVLDRYTDAAVVLGIVVYSVRLALDVHPYAVLGIGFLALAGSGLISYSSARADALEIGLGSPTLCSKGTRHAVMALSGILAPVWIVLPFLALCYLAVHTNVVVVLRIVAAFRNRSADGVPRA